LWRKIVHSGKKSLFFQRKQKYNLLVNYFCRRKNHFVELIDKNMTKADIVAGIAEETGLERVEALKAVESFMTAIKASLAKGENVYLRGFGSFVVKERAEKTGRNISKNTTIIIPAHNIPSFKPAKTFVEEVKNKVQVS
jgi:DNA-binding protein HU-beta